MSTPRKPPEDAPLPALDADALGVEPEDEDAEPVVLAAEEAPARDTPPAPSRRRRRSSSAAKPGRKPNTNARASTRRSAVERGVSNTINAMAFTVTMLDEFDGACIARGEADLTGAVMATADANPRFFAWLEGAIKGGSYLQLVAASGAILVPILAHHRLLPPSLAFAMPQAERAPDYPPPAPEPQEASYGGDGEPVGGA
jgi:hypothetical protein